MWYRSQRNLKPVIYFKRIQLFPSYTVFLEKASWKIRKLSVDKQNQIAYNAG